MLNFGVALDVSGKQGPARTQAESDADGDRDRLMIEAKHARLAQLQEQFEAQGLAPEKARVAAAQEWAKGQE